VKFTALYVMLLLLLAAILAAYFPYVHALNNFRNTGVNPLILSGVIVLIVLGIVSIALGATMRANTPLGQPSTKGWMSSGVTFILLGIATLLSNAVALVCLIASLPVLIYFIATIALMLIAPCISLIVALINR
jgi:hypothetical protein